MDMIECLGGYRVVYWQQTDRTPEATGAMAFTDCYKHMECLGGMRFQSFLTNGHLFTRATPGTPASIT